MNAHAKERMLWICTEGGEDHLPVSAASYRDHFGLINKDLAISRKRSSGASLLGSLFIAYLECTSPVSVCRIHTDKWLDLTNSGVVVGTF